jgi:Dolichyl-phosphate-mannose-protein mannosyltransferase
MSASTPAVTASDLRRSIECRGDARWSVWLYVLVAILLLAMVWGLFVRFNGLGSRPLAVDEYFSITAVQYLLDKGVAEFPTGGYYMRGLPLQYLQAGSVLLFGDNEFAHRLPAALFSVFTLVFVFLYARIFLPWPLAAVCVAILAVSGWEIEFSRFSRMYAAFQCITVAFFLAYHQAYFKGSEKLKYLPHALALVAVTFHALGVFLLPFLFLPLFIDRNARQGAPLRNPWVFAIVSMATVLVGIGFWQLESRLRHYHVQQSLPNGFHPQPHTDALGPLDAYRALPIGTSVLIAFVAMALVTGCFLLFWRRSKTISTNSFSALNLGLLLLLLSTVFHLFAVSLCIVVVLLIRYQLHHRVLKDKFRLGMLILSGLIACAWILYAIHDQSWRDRVLASSLPRALRVVFFGWPDFYQPILYPLIDALPFLTIIFLSSLAWHVGQLGHKNITVILRHPIMIILGVFSAIAVVTPIIKPLYEETRYFYNVYPFIILLIVMAIYEVLRRTLGRVTGRRSLVVLSGFVAIGLFAISGDFNLRQLLHINSPEIAFRTGALKQYEHIWFWRFDERSPAEFLNAHRNDVNALVLSSQARTLPYYLESEPNFAYYCPREEKDGLRRFPAAFQSRSRYENFARAQGTLELWTGHRLLGTEQELSAYTDRVRSLYLVRRVKPAEQEFDINHVWPDRLISYERVFLSSDGRTEVVKIVLRQPTGNSASPSPNSPLGRRGEDEGEEFGMYTPTI